MEAKLPSSSVSGQGGPCPTDSGVLSTAGRADGDIVTAFLPWATTFPMQAKSHRAGRGLGAM
jgi:hypothetical protein